MTPDAWEPWVCRVLGETPSGLRQLTQDQIAQHLGYADGLALAQEMQRGSGNTRHSDLGT